MKTKLLLIIMFIISCQSSPKKKVASVFETHSEISETADAYFTKLTDLARFNGVVLLKKGDDLVLKQSYNMQTDTTSSLYVVDDSQFDLRSIAKLFAKISIIQLENDGKLSRNDKLNKFLPNFPNAEKITIEHLMTNRSGLPRAFETSEKPLYELSPNKVLELASKSSLEFEPGSNELYSNVGFQLLYYVIGQATDLSYEDYINQQYFRPLKMMHSGSNFLKGNDRKANYAFGHYMDDSKNIICECTFQYDDMQMGNLFSTVDDLDKFMSHLDKDELKDLIDEGHISHAGGTKGKRAYVERNFEKDYSIIFLSNYDEIPFQDIINNVRAILEEQTIEMPKAVNRQMVDIPTHILKQYEGTYDFVDAGHLILTIKFENDSLFVYQNGENNGPLYPESESVFFGDKTSEESVEFIINAEGTFEMIMDFKGAPWKGVKIGKD